MNYKSPQETHSTLSTPEIPPVEFFGFPIVNTPPMPSEFHNRDPPPSPSEILKAVRGMVWIFSGIAQ